MKQRETILLTKQDIQPVFGMTDTIEAVEEAFRLYGEGEVEMPPKVYLTFDRGDLRCMPVYMPTKGIAGVKNVNVHPHNTSLPTVMATITLVDPEDGFPLAVMDGTYLTNLRTGAAGAVAAKYLARRDSTVAGFVGAGRQACTQIDGLVVTMPDLSRVLAFDLRSDAAARFCDWCRDEHGLEAGVAASVEELVQGTDILVTTTPARSPVVKDEWVRPGTHVNAIGADAAGKQELEPALLRRSVVVIDDWEQASHSGEINVPLKQGFIRREDIHGDIGEVLTGRKCGRESGDQITIFDSTGLAVQDISSAYEAYQRVINGDSPPAGIAFF